MFGGFVTFLQGDAVHYDLEDTLHQPGETGRDRRPDLVTWLFPAVAAVLGFIQAWGGRHLMNPDGVSYLDIADAYRRGDWNAALNTYWNPLYTWVLSAGLAVIHPSPAWEFPAVHLINYVVFLVALGSFHFMLVNLIRFDRASRRVNDGALLIPNAVWWSVGYTAFTVFTLQWIGLEVVAPDMCVASLVFLCAGLVLRLRSGGPARIAFALGICLGLTYLAKVATAIPVVASFFLAGVFTTRNRLTHLLAISVGLAVAAGPYVLALSMREGRLTLSDAGTLNYAWYVNAVPNHWLGEGGRFGTPVNPHRRILDFPAAYAYDPSASGTYPGWFDPAHWYEGVRPRFDVARELYAIKGNAERLFQWFSGGSEATLFAGLLTLFLFSATSPGAWRFLAGRWFLLAPAALAIAMYSLVWVESRFLGGLLTLLCMGLLSALRLKAGGESFAVLRSVVIGMVTVALGSVAGLTVIRAYENGREPSKDWRVATALHASGIVRGDRVAVIGHVNRAGWARLAGVKIIAEIPAESEGDFDTADEATQTKAIDTLFATGVHAVVVDHPVATGCRSGWRSARATGFNICPSVKAGEKR